MEVSVVIPTYNEAENIRPLIEKISGELDKRDHEIIVVDDNSPDGTAEKVRELQDDFEKLRLFERKDKSGIGSAYRHGFKKTEGDIVVQMDADFSHPPEYIPDLIEVLEKGADVSVGSRYVEGGERKDPLHRRIFPIIGSYLYRYGAKIPVRDTTSGFKAYRKEELDKILDEDLPDGFHFQAASLLRLVENGSNIEEVPIEFRERRAGEPKYDQVFDLWKNGLFFLKTFLRKNQRPIKFGAVGVSGVAVNMGLLYLLTEYFNIFYLISAGFAVEISIIWNYVLNDFWTFRNIGGETLRHFFERLGKFNLVSLIGLGLNLSILYSLTEFLNIYYLLSNLIAIIAVFAWNYLGNVKWTW